MSTASPLSNPSPKSAIGPASHRHDVQTAVDITSNYQ